MERGQMVQIYQDPITKQQPEGVAMLRGRITEDVMEDGLEEWMVNFVHDHPSETYRRIVDPADVVKD